MQKSINRHDRIVYFLCWEDWTPFYVGKGSQTRPGSHIKESLTKRNSPKLTAIRHLLKSISRLPIVVIAKGLSDAEACAMEILFIAAIGRKDKGLGTLLNLTDGGDGVVGHRHDNATKKKISEANFNPISIRNRIAALATPEVRQKISDALARPEVKERQRQGILKAFRDSDTKERHRVAMAEINSKPNVIEKHRQTKMEDWARLTAEDYASRVASIRESVNRPSVKARQIAGTKAAWAKPGERERRGALVRAGHARKKAERMELLKKES